MIPLNAQEATDLLRVRTREIAQCERMIDLFTRQLANEQARLTRLHAEFARLEACADKFGLPLSPSSNPIPHGKRDGGGL